MAERASLFLLLTLLRLGAAIGQAVAANRLLFLLFFFKGVDDNGMTLI